MQLLFCAGLTLLILVPALCWPMDDDSYPGDQEAMLELDYTYPLSSPNDAQSQGSYIHCVTVCAVFNMLILMPIIHSQLKCMKMVSK